MLTALATGSDGEVIMYVGFWTYQDFARGPWMIKLMIECGQMDNVTAVKIKNDDAGENSFLRIDGCMVFLLQR